MTLPENWKKIPIPLGLTVSVILALGAASYWTYGYAQSYHHQFLLARNYEQDQNRKEHRALSKDRRQLDQDVTVLESKQQFTPAKFTPSDQVVLKKKKKYLQEVEREIGELEKRMGK